MKRSKGFSLAEMMAVIAVLGILAVLLLPNVINAYKDARKGVLLDEAKSVYAEALNKYATEKAEGKVVSVVTDAENSDDNTYNLDLTNKDVEYFVRLDGNGEVISLVVIDGDYCIAGRGDFLDSAKRDDVLEYYNDDGTVNSMCAKNNSEGLYAKFILDTKGGRNDSGLIEGSDDPVIYYYYGQGWYKKITETNEMVPLPKLTNIPNIDDKVFNRFVDKDGNVVIDGNGNISNSQDTIARYKDTKYCNDQVEAEKDFSKCVVTLSAEYRKPAANLVFGGCPDSAGKQASMPIESEKEYDLPSGENVTLTFNGYKFVGWTEGSCDATQVIEGKYSKEVLKSKDESAPEKPYDGSDINLYAEWYPEVIEASNVICEPDDDNYCKKPVFYRYGGDLYVLYRITNEGYKAILYGLSDDSYSYLQTDCCNHGNCYYTSVNYTRSQLAKKLNGTWLNGKNKDRLVNASWYSGYKNNELLNIETARVGIMNYAEYLHTNGKGYTFVYEGALKKNGSTAWWWTMTPTTNQPYYYDGQYYLANVILRYDPTRKVVDYDEMTVNGTTVGTNHIYGSDTKLDVHYRPVVVFKPRTPIKLGEGATGKWGSKTNPFIIE